MGNFLAVQWEAFLLQIRVWISRQLYQTLEAFLPWSRWGDFPSLLTKLSVPGWFWWVFEPAPGPKRYWKGGAWEEACQHGPLQRRQVCLWKSHCETWKSDVCKALYSHQEFLLVMFNKQGCRTSIPWPPWPRSVWGSAITNWRKTTQLEAKLQGRTSHRYCPCCWCSEG